MEIKIALAGNPNCGKTTLFNALTGSNQFVGNWPGVTVEKKEGKLKKHKDVTIMDLPGIYSLSPYTLEEVVARNYLVGERPDAILNIIDGTNLERTLYLTTQLTELGIPVVVAINMIDLVKKNGDSINIDELSRQLGCKVVEISALKGTGIMEAAEAAIKAAGSTKKRRLFTICLKNSSVGTLSRFLSVTTRFLQSWTFRRMLLTTLKKIFRRLKKNLTMTQRVSSLTRDTSTLPQSSRAVIRRKTRVSLQHQTRLIRL